MWPVIADIDWGSIFTAAGTCLLGLAGITAGLVKWMLATQTEREKVWKEHETRMLNLVLDRTDALALKYDSAIKSHDETLRIIAEGEQKRSETSFKILLTTQERQNKIQLGLNAELHGLT